MPKPAAAAISAGAVADQVRRQGNGKQASAHQRDADEQQRAKELGALHPPGGEHRHRGDEAEARQDQRGPGQRQSEHLLGIEDEERGQRGVAHHPEPLGEEQCPHAGARRN